jgi:hypothetical protein
MKLSAPTIHDKCMNLGMFKNFSQHVELNHDTFVSIACGEIEFDQICNLILGPLSSIPKGSRRACGVWRFSAFLHALPCGARLHSTKEWK